MKWNNAYRYIGSMGLLLLWLACQPEAAPPPEEAPPTRLEQLTALIQQNPADYSLYAERARLQYENGHTEAALADVEQAIARYGSGPDLHYLKGFLAFAKGDTATARKAFQQAISLGTTQPEVWYQLGQIYFLQGRLSLARKGFERAAHMDSLQPAYQLALGLLHERQQQYTQARAAYLQALRLDSTFIKACSQLHNLYLHSLGREDSAMYFNRLLLRQQPTHPLGWKNEGDYLLRQALSIRQQTQQALLNETLQKAIEAYSAALLADTGYVQARYNRGYCYFLTDQHQQAMEDFERLLRRDSLHAQAHFMLGSIYEFYADTEKARFHYTQVLKAQPAHADARQALKELATKP